MISESEILEYTKTHYINEHNLIIRSMINYYALRLRDDKNAAELLHQERLYDGVIDLFHILSDLIANALGGDSDTIFETLKTIHIKT